MSVVYRCRDIQCCRSPGFLYRPQVFWSGAYPDPHRLLGHAGALTLTYDVPRPF